MWILKLYFTILSSNFCFFSQQRSHTGPCFFTLDLNIDFICSEDIFISDHYVIVFNFSFNEPLSPLYGWLALAS